MKPKQRCSVLVLAVLTAAFFVPQVSAQTGTVKGTCKNMDGKPFVGAVIEFTRPRVRPQVHPQDERQG